LARVRAHSFFGLTGPLTGSLPGSTHSGPGPALCRPTTPAHSSEASRRVDRQARSAAPWDKQIMGTGYRFRSQVELLLYGTRGRGVPIPLPADRVPNLLSIRRSQRHSEKPRAFADLIARQYGGVSRVEMFARSGGRAAIHCPCCQQSPRLRWRAIWRARCRRWPTIARRDLAC
jgi:hypothetical protein